MSYHGRRIEDGIVGHYCYCYTEGTSDSFNLGSEAQYGAERI